MGRLEGFIHPKSPLDRMLRETLRLICSASLVAPSEESVKLGCVWTSGADALHAVLDLARLGEGDAKGLGTHGRGSGLKVRVLLAQILDHILARLIPAERCLKRCQY